MKTLAWVAGVFWLLVAVTVHAVAGLLIRIPGRLHLPLVWQVVLLDEWAGKMAMACAKEAGLNVEGE